MNFTPQDASRFYERQTFTPLPDDEEDDRFAPPEDDTAPAAVVAAPIRATPFEWCEPAKIPPREWVYGRHLIRRYVSTTVAPGGLGKSSLALVEAVAMVSGKDLLGERPTEPLRVWYWNGEDPADELQRRVMAVALHYELRPQDIGGRLFINSGRDTEIVIAQQNRDGVTVAAPVVEAVKATIRENRIDVVIIDPFVSSHRVSENDNGAIDRVAKTWARIAEETNCAVELIHHARKTNGNEVTIEDSRGAVALLSAARSARTLNGMTKEEAERAGVENRRAHFRVDNGKANLAPPPEGSTWFKMKSVALGNGPLNSDGDRIGVVTPWTWPDPLAGINTKDLRAAQAAVSAGGQWRENSQCKDWVGIPIAQALNLDLSKKPDRSKVIRLLKVWTTSGMFVTTQGVDEHRKPRSFVEVGEPASD